MEPSSPYRGGKPLADLIPPDRRRTKTITLVVASMIAGACLYAVGALWTDGGRHDVPPIPPPPPAAAQRIAPSVLEGPDGTRALPTGTLAIVHVWVQGCADCMPAFEALRDLEERGGFGVDVTEINVAYGRADTNWAARYGVRSNLVFDPGGAAIVKPLGIGTFTTLVVDEQGRVLHRDRPDREGYADRVVAVVRAHRASTPDKGRPIAQGDVQRVVAAHAGAVHGCWEGASGGTTSSVRVSLVVETDGAPTKVDATGEPADVAACIARQVRTWRFPRPDQPTPVTIPFELTKQ